MTNHDGRSAKPPCRDQVAISIALKRRDHAGMPWREDPASRRKPLARARPQAVQTELETSGNVRVTGTVDSHPQIRHCGRTWSSAEHFLHLLIGRVPCGNRRLLAACSVISSEGSVTRDAHTACCWGTVQGVQSPGCEAEGLR